MTPPTDSYRVLVVDDEEAIVELVGEYLRARGHEVHSAGDGDEALAIARTVALDVVLTDLRLPVRGGMSLLEALVDLSTPVATIVMTGFGTVETATQAMKYGATDYLLKPVRLRDVYDALERAVRAARASRAQERNERRVAFYEAALEVEEHVAFDVLAELLGDALAAECAGPCAVQVTVEEGGSWREVASVDHDADAGKGDATDDDATDDDPSAIDEVVDGVRVRLWSDLPLPAGIEARARAWCRLLADARLRAGADDLPTRA